MGTLVSAGASLAGAAVFELSTGEKIAIYSNSSDSIVVYKDLDSTPALATSQTNTQIFGGTPQLYAVHACVDSADVIHVVAACATSTRDTAYNTLTDVEGTPSWGTWEQVWDYSSTAFAHIPWASMTVAVDQNDVPHVIGIDTTKVHGSFYDQVVYSNRIGGTWSGPDVLSGTADETYRGAIQGLVVRDNNSAEALAYNFTLSDIVYWSRASGSWGGESSYTGTFHGKALGVAQESGAGTIRRMHLSGINIYMNNADTTFDASVTFENQLLPYIRNSDDVLYVLYFISTDGIGLLVYDGTWTDIGLLDNPTSESTVFTSWSYLIQNNDASMDYLYNDATDMYWNEYSFGGAVRIPRYGFTNFQVPGIV